MCTVLYNVCHGVHLVCLDVRTVRAEGLQAFAVRFAGLATLSVLYACPWRLCRLFVATDSATECAQCVCLTLEPLRIPTERASVMAVGCVVCPRCLHPRRRAHQKYLDMTHTANNPTYLCQFDQSAIRHSEGMIRRFVAPRGKPAQSLRLHEWWLPLHHSETLLCR